MHSRSAAVWARLAGAAVLAWALQPAAWAQQPVADSDDTGADTTLVPTPATRAPQAASAMLLDLARAGSGWVAVGAHGDILVSDDGDHWKQVPAPVDTMLTRVRFLDAQHGWAIGYDGSVLATSDGGKTWSLLQYDAAWGRPYFDILFFDPSNGLLAGANGTLKRTADGGKTWQEVSADLFQDQPNLYNLVALGDGSLLLAGERGFLARSTDKGASWVQLKSPYVGSYFGVLATGGAGALVFGLRGNAFYAANLGKAAPLSAKDRAAMQAEAANAENARSDKSPVSTVAGWVHLKSDDKEPLFGGALGADGRILLFGQNGRVMRADLVAATLTPLSIGTDININAALIDGKSVVAVGTSGVGRLTPQ